MGGAKRCGPAHCYSISTEDSHEARVTKKDGVCCYWAHLLYIDREREAQSTGGILDYEAVFSHIKCRRRLGSRLKIMDAGQRGTYQRRWGGGSHVSFAGAGPGTQNVRMGQSGTWRQ